MTTKALFGTRHILQLLLLILLAESISIGLYGYFTVKTSRVDFAETIIAHDLHTVNQLLRPSTSQEKEVRFFKNLYHRLPRQSFSLGSRPLPNALVIHSANDLDKLHSHTLLKLSRHNLLSMSIYLPSYHQWANFTAIENIWAPWRTFFLILMVNLLITSMVWLAVAFYYRHTLSGKILSAIKGDTSKKRGLNKSIEEEIQNYLNERDLMLSALAHDIKTPLTEARLRLEFLEDQETAGQVREKLDQIHQIVRSSLEFARQPAAVKKVPVDIISLTESIVENYEDGIFDISFHTALPSHEIKLEINLYRRMLTNLIENAKKYANNARIIIEKPHANSLNIICEDDGPGVPEKFLPLLTIPYYRMDQSRSRDTGGTGLGLAIVKKIAELHQGKVQISAPETGQGFKVTVTLPD